MAQDIDPNHLKLTDLTYIKRAGLHNTKYECPHCQGHAFTVQNDTGIYYCFNCGRSGKVQLPDEEDQAGRHDGSSPITASHSHSGKGSQASANETPRTGKQEGVPSIIEDYVSLPAEVLDAIEDVSDAESVTGSQLAVRQYLLSQGITLGIARMMRLGVTERRLTTGKKEGEEEAAGQSLPCLVYRNYVEGFCCNAKYRAVNVITTTRNLKGGPVKVSKVNKAFSQDSSFTPCAPYGIDCLCPAEGEETSPIDDALIITEGEKDCVVLRMLGYPYVISVANGAQTKHEESFEAFLPWLQRVEKVIICGDQDKPGRGMVRQLIDLLDDKLVMTVSWDQRRLGKDIGDVFLHHGGERVHELINGAQVVAREDLEEYTRQEDRQQVLANLKGAYDHGYSLGVDALMDRHFKLFDQGGLIIVTGTPGTGKTDFLNFLTTRLMVVRDASVCYCSFETADKLRHASDIASIWMGEAHPELLPEETARPYAERAMDHVTHIILDKDRPTVGRILRKAEVCLRRHPNTQFLVIDPYLYLNITEGNRITETDAIRNMLTDVRAWALLHHVWVFIVAHPRKLNKEDGSTEWEKIDYYSISGSANWANVADYVISINRVKHDMPAIDYTAVDILKVRDQKICIPGTMYFIRHPSGRYFICEGEEAAKGRRGKLVGSPYPLAPPPSGGGE